MRIEWKFGCHLCGYFFRLFLSGIFPSFSPFALLVINTLCFCVHGVLIWCLVSLELLISD